MTFDEILALIDKLDGSSLSEIRVSDGDQTVFLRRDEPGTAVPAPAATVAAQAPAAPADAADAAAAAAPASASVTEQAGRNGLEIISSPIVGTFYRAPSPDSPVFVEEGDEVKSGDTICILEAMKVMNELEAEFDLRVERILAESGQMVEYGTPLIEVHRL